MSHLYTYIALDIAQERAREAAASRRAAQVADGRHGIVRRGLASGFAFVSRGSAAAVRRLDECTADDLNRALATAK